MEGSNVHVRRLPVVSDRYLERKIRKHDHDHELDLDDDKKSRYNLHQQNSYKRSPKESYS